MSAPITGDPVPFAGCFAATDDARRNARLVFAGLPDDSRSSYLRGAARGPARIRAAYDGNSYNSTTESGVDLRAAIADLGDVPSRDSWPQTGQAYHEYATALLRARRCPFFAGGDHAVTVPIVAALAVLQEPVHVIQIDAHPDLYPEFEGRRDSHACVGARILEMPHVASLTQIGIRTMNAEQSAHAAHFLARLHLLPARDLTGAIPALPHIPPAALVYITLDVDGFDPAYAPGVAHPVPGGLSPRQVLNFINSGNWRLAGMDAVEVNPARDINDQTAILAARVLHEAMGYVARQDGATGPGAVG